MVSLPHWRSNRNWELIHGSFGPGNILVDHAWFTPLFKSHRCLISDQSKHHEKPQTWALRWSQQAGCAGGAFLTIWEQLTLMKCWITILFQHPWGLTSYNPRKMMVGRLVSLVWDEIIRGFHVKLYWCTWYESFIVSIEMILGHRVKYGWHGSMVTFWWELSGQTKLRLKSVNPTLNPSNIPNWHCRMNAKCHSSSSQLAGYMPPAMPPAMPMPMPSWDVPAGDGGGIAAMFDHSAGSRAAFA